MPAKGLQAIIVQHSMHALEFKPTEFEGEWELIIMGSRGGEHGGKWTNEEVARDVVEAIFGPT